jgi:hypothetical protein
MLPSKSETAVITDTTMTIFSISLDSDDKQLVVPLHHHIICHSSHLLHYFHAGTSVGKIRLLLLGSKAVVSPKILVVLYHYRYDLSA